MRVLLTLGRRAGLPFEKAYELAATTALAYLPPRHAGELLAVLEQHRALWAVAYQRASVAPGRS